MLPTDDTTYKWIEQYLREELSPEEVTKFESRLKSDNDFLQTFIIEKDLFISVAFQEEQRLGGFLKTLHEEKIPKKMTAVVRQIPNRKMLLAAAAVLTGLILCFYFLIPETLTNEQLAANYYKKPTYEQHRGTSDALPNQNQIQSLYKTGSYKKAIVLLSNHKNSPSSLLYQAICHYELNQTDNALAILSDLQANPDFNDESTWYLALCYLKSDNEEKARFELQKLVSGEIGSTPKRKEKAIELLENL